MTEPNNRSARRRTPRPPRVSKQLAARAASLTDTEIIGVLAESLAWHADRAAIDSLLHYTHWIPVGRGFTDAFLAEYWPGWTLASIVRVFDAAGIRQLPRPGRPGAPHGGRCHWRVKTLHFNGQNEFVVEWNDLTQDDGRFLGLERSVPRIPTWARDAATDTDRKTDPVRMVDLSGRRFFDDHRPEPGRGN
ncbi:MAG: hypothetical protein RLZZ305_1310 [Actinomycetota bacterium]|jgi:hypothetical protein